MWQPIETAPKDGRWILVVNSFGAIFMVARDTESTIDEWLTGQDSYVRSTFLTHWMPLPEPPR